MNKKCYVLSKNMPEGTDYNPTAITWNVSLEEIEKRNRRK